MAKESKTASKVVTEYVLQPEDGQGCFSHGNLDVVKAEKIARIRSDVNSGIAPKSYSIIKRVNEYDAKGKSVCDCEETELKEEN